MDEDEDFRSLFFAEARELLDAFQDHIGTLDTGYGDTETVHAAFRAMHSIKGGAAAFGFERLIGLAHQAETLMDRLREGEGATPHVLQALVRAGDLLLKLLDAEEGGPAVPEADLATVLAELVGKNPAAAARRVVRITPGPDFDEAGFDMLRLIRAARTCGLTEVTVEGVLAAPAGLDAARPGLTWVLTFTGDEDLDAFFWIYRDRAGIEGDLGAATAPPAEPVSEPAPTAPPPDQARSLRVETARIDRLVNLVGEVLIAQSVLAQRVADTGARPGSDLVRALDTSSRQLRELQERVMAIRAQPVDAVFRRMPALVRDLSRSLGKPARLTLEGGRTEVDATVIAELSDPLTHMIRNAMDHGLEPCDVRRAAGKPDEGQVRLTALHRGDHVTLTVTDDGGGIDRDRVLAKALERGILTSGDRPTPEEIDALVFHPGFSTASDLSEVSGRGVGMDVVRRRIIALGGRCAVSSTPGRGTRFTITLPLTLAVMDGMTVRTAGQKYVLPLASVCEAVRLGDACSEHRLPDGSRMLKRRGAYIPLFSLADALNRGGADERVALIIDTGEGGSLAVAVEELIGQRQVVLKSLEGAHTPIAGVSGATILGDGQVALVLDVARILNRRIPSPEAVS
ncbi:chemotaxis protein CheA [Halovulum sp. GXIMD14794]